MKLTLLIVLTALLAGCASATYQVDKRECEVIGPDHLNCAQKGVHKLK